MFFAQIEMFHVIGAYKGTSLRLLFVHATEHTSLRMFLNIWREILFPGDLHDTAL